MRTGSPHPARRSFTNLGRAAVVVAASLAAANCLPSLSGGPDPRLSERDRVIHLLSRTTYGVRPQDVEEAMRLGRREWLDRQLQPDAIQDLTLDARLAVRSPQRIVDSAAAARPAPVAPRPPAMMPNAALPDTAATRDLGRALETARGQLTDAQEQLATALRGFQDAQQRVDGNNLPAARTALEEAIVRHEQAQRNQALAQRVMDAVLQRITALTTQPTPIPNVVTPQLPVVRGIAAGLPINTLVANKVERAVYSERQLQEVMTDFWFNHFNVFYNKAQVRVVIDDYEQNAIRANVFGRFEDLLIATAEHPAMMVYLDNFQSTAPPPAPIGAQPGRPARPQRGGLNENYARELMELHTLGVDGGYTQQDVIEVARAFTGWGIGNRPASQPGAPAQPSVAFQFNAQQHDNGGKTVLGQSVAGGRGMEEGLQILGMLARHPATARHIATKLVSHFVSDEPPPELVDEIARVFLETDGDLAAVTRALFLSSDFYAPEHYRAKVKRPFEYVVSALRVTGANVVPQGQGLVAQLRSFRHLPYSEAAPTGYATTAEDWVSAGAMLARMNFGLDLVAGRLPGISLDRSSPLGEAWPAAARVDLAAQSVIGTDAPSAELQSAIDALLQKVQVGAKTDQLAALIAEDLMRAPAAVGSAEPRGIGLAPGARREVAPAPPQGTPAPGVLQGGRFLGGTPGVQAPAPASGLVIQRRGPANQALAPALRALGLALGSPEFQRY